MSQCCKQFAVKSFCLFSQNPEAESKELMYLKFNPAMDTANSLSIESVILDFE